MEKLNEILGYKKQVKNLKAICDLLKNTDKYLQFGAEIPKGLLLYGEKGVGKTFMAKALIEDCGRVPFYFKGYGSKEIKKLFKTAKKAGRAVILIDDIDYLSDDGDCEEYRQLSDELDEIENGEIFVVVTAEDLDDLPGYLLDDDAFAIKMKINLPEFKDRQEMFKPLLADAKIEDNFNVDDFICFADEWTYPMAEHALNDAALIAVYEGNEKITMHNIIEAGLKLKETTLADEYDKDTAYHEAGHAAVHMLLGGEASCLILTEGSGGFFREKDVDDVTYKDRERRYIVGMAGKACSELFFGDSAFGASTDLKCISEGLETDLSKLAIQGFNFYDTTELDSPEYSNRLANHIQSTMKKYYDEAKRLLEQNKPLVIEIAEKLKEKYYLLSSELHNIFAEYTATKK